MVLKEKVQAMLNGLAAKALSPEERAVMKVIVEKSVNKRRVTQAEIAYAVPALGSHQKFEKGKKWDTTLRAVRQVVRDLRIKWNAPILSDSSGYYIPETEREVSDYLEQLEATAKAQSKAWFETYAAMKNAFGVTSNYFEGQNQPSLFMENALGHEKK